MKLNLYFVLLFILFIFTRMFEETFFFEVKPTYLVVLKNVHIDLPFPLAIIHHRKIRLILQSKKLINSSPTLAIHEETTSTAWLSRWFRNYNHTGPWSWSEGWSGIFEFLIGRASNEEGQLDKIDAFPLLLYVSLDFLG